MHSPNFYIYTQTDSHTCLPTILLIQQNPFKIIHFVAFSLGSWRELWNKTNAEHLYILIRIEWKKLIKKSMIE